MRLRSAGDLIGFAGGAVVALLDQTSMRHAWHVIVVRASDDHVLPQGYRTLMSNVLLDSGYEATAWSVDAALKAHAAQHQLERLREDIARLTGVESAA